MQSVILTTSFNHVNVMNQTIINKKEKKRKLFPKFQLILILCLQMRILCDFLKISHWNYFQWHSHWEQSAPLDSKKLPKIGKKGGENQERGTKREKIGKRGQNREGSFTLPLLTDRAGYATDYFLKFLWVNMLLGLELQLDAKIQIWNKIESTL